MAALTEVSIARVAYKYSIKKSVKLLNNYFGRKKSCYRCFSKDTHDKEASSWNSIGKNRYPVDSSTNVTPRILSYINRNLHNQEYHPLQLIKRRIVNFMYSHYPGARGPRFSVYDQVIHMLHI